MITLTKIAKLSHVSVSTVSKAFSMSNEVNEKTRELIFEVARENNCFREYFNAKYPKYVIAIVCPEFYSTYYSSTLSLIQSNLERYNCEITVASTNFSEDTERELIEYYSNYTTVDAIINYGTITAKDIRTDIPIINMSKSSDNKNYICHNFNEALNNAIGYFIKSGISKIGFISEKKTIKKLDAFRKTMNSNRCAIDDNHIVITEKRFEDGGYSGMEKIFKQGDIPGAIICGYDDMAIGAMRCIFDHGYKIPEDIMVMGMNDISVSSYVEPPLSSISLKNELTCKFATDMLMARLNGTEYPDSVEVQCELILRKSTNRKYNG